MCVSKRFIKKNNNNNNNNNKLNLQGTSIVIIISAKHLTISS